MPDKRMIYGKEQTTKAIGRAVFEVFFSLSTKWPKGAYPLTDGYEFTGIDTNNAIKPFITEFFAQWQRGQIRVVSYAVYQQEIDTTGQCAAFACDVQNSTDIDAVTKIKLPTITRYLRPKGLTNPIGTSGLDTLPALSGIFPTIALGDGATGLTEGVFSIADTGTMTGVNSGNNVTTTPYNTVSMDISDMVSVATEVMPRHANLALYIQIFNVDYDAVGGSENLDLQAKVDELDRLLRGHLEDTSPTAHPQYVTHEEVDAVGLYPRAVEPDVLLPFDYNDQIVNMRKYVSIDRNPIHSPDDTRSFMLEVVASEMDLRRRVVQEATQYEDLTEETMTSLRQLAEDYAAGLTPPSGEDEDAYREEQANLKYTELLADRVNLIDMKKYYRIGIVDSLNKDETAGMATSWSEWKLVGSGAGREIFDVFYSLSTATPNGALPLWTGELIGNCRVVYPDFWNKALEYSKAEPPKIRVVTDEVYNQELTQFGETGAFVINETTGDMRLPKIVHFCGTISSITDIGIAQAGTVGEHAHMYASPWDGGSAKQLGGGEVGFYVYRGDLEDTGVKYIDEGGGKSPYYTKPNVLSGRVHNVLKIINEVPVERANGNHPLNISVGDYIFVNIASGVHNMKTYRRTQITDGTFASDYEEVTNIPTSINSPDHVKLALYIQVFNGEQSESNLNFSEALQALNNRITMLENNIGSGGLGGSSSFLRATSRVKDTYLGLRPNDRTTRINANTGYWADLAPNTSDGSNDSVRNKFMWIPIAPLSAFSEVMDDNYNFTREISGRVSARVAKDYHTTSNGYAPGEFLYELRMVTNGDGSNEYHPDVNFLPVVPNELNDYIAGVLNIQTPTLIAEVPIGWHGAPIVYVNRNDNMAYKYNHTTDWYNDFLNGVEWVVDLEISSGEISGQSNDYVVESDTTNDIISNRRTWYRVYKSGWVEQGGYVALNASDTFLTVQYPILLSSDPWNFHVDPIYANDGYHANGVRNMTAGGFEYFTNTGGDVMDVTGFYWEAKGYKA